MGLIYGLNIEPNLQVWFLKLDGLFLKLAPTRFGRKSCCISATWFSHTLEWAPSVNLGPKNYSISRSLNSGVM